MMNKGGAGFSVNSNAGWNQREMEDHQKGREQRKNKSGEEKRLQEIKAGVITSSVGLGMMIFLRFLFKAIASTLPWQEANILRGLWWIGWVPLLVGLAVIFNGLFISKKIVELNQQQDEDVPPQTFQPVPITTPVQQLNEASPFQFADYSIAEPTTTKLREPAPISSPRDTNQ
ncbi:MAG: hypothetical protein ACRD82_10860 [Blastocatellia bacterium]